MAAVFGELDSEPESESGSSVLLELGAGDVFVVDSSLPSLPSSLLD
jgi:hypothetical protein